MNIVLDNRILYIKIVKPSYFMERKATEEEISEGVIVPFINPKKFFTNIGNCESLPLTAIFKRSGVIPYTVINNDKFFCLGLNSKYGNLSDFGRNIREYETFASCAADSLNESSFGIFNFTPTTIYRNSTFIYDQNLIILLTSVKVENTKSIDILFHQRYLKSTNTKLCSIMWIHENTFFKLLKTGMGVNQEQFTYPSVYRPISNIFKNIIGQDHVV